MKFSEFLTNKYLDWQKEAGELKTQRAFAEYLDVPHSLLSQWFTGIRSPSKKKAEAIAEKLGPEVYDVLGLARPDVELKSIVKRWRYARSIDRDIIHLLLRTDYAKCMVCGSKEDLMLGHLTTLADGGTDDADNLGVFCSNCLRERRMNKNKLAPSKRVKKNNIENVQ